MASPRRDHDEFMSLYYGSPTSTLSSGFGQSYNTSSHRDDNLPEVAEDASPRALTNLEAEYERKFDSHSEPESTERLDDTAKVVVPSEHSNGYQYPQTAASANMAVPWDATTVSGATTKSDIENEKSLANEEAGGPQKDRKIMGMTRKVFFIMLAVVLFVIVVAVGGGVGGAIAVTKSHNNSADAAASSTSSVSPTPTSSQVSSTTTSAAATPTFLNNQTAPSGNGFRFQGFSRDNYTGASTTIVTEEGGTDFEFDIHSYVWIPNLTSCCISFCKNATKAGMTGWWCNERYQKKASGSFPRLFVWCGGDRNDAAAKCS